LVYKECVFERREMQYIHRYTVYALYYERRITASAKVYIDSLLASLPLSWTQ